MSVSWSSSSLSMQLGSVAGDDQNQQIMPQPAVQGFQAAEVLITGILKRPVVAEAAQAEKEEVLKEKGMSGKNVVLLDGLSSADRKSDDDGRKGKNKFMTLTEEEKEAKRWRRIMSNREAARETIRKKQVIYAILRRKLAELTQENQNLEEERNLALEEYEALHKTNKKLKNQIAGKLGGSLRSSRGKGKAPPLATSDKESGKEKAPPAGPSSIDIPYFGCNAAPPPPLWLPQTGSLDGLTTLGLFNDGREKGPPTVGNVVPWCLVPYPWFVFVTNTPQIHQDEPTKFIQFLPTKGEEENGTTASIVSSTKTTSCVENVHGFLPVHTINKLQLCDDSKNQATPSFLSGDDGKNLIGGRRRWVVDVVASAEARKRRKEMMRRVRNS